VLYFEDGRHSVFASAFYRVWRAEEESRSSGGGVGGGSLFGEEVLDWISRKGIYNISIDLGYFMLEEKHHDTYVDAVSSRIWPDSNFFRRLCSTVVAER